jgi:hypothetical protein
MTRKNETSPAAARTASRRDWAQPRMRRLKTSAAELGVGDTIDAEGMS